MKNTPKIFNNIDIKNEAGMLFLGVRDDGEYTIYNKHSTIKEIPEDILQEILE